MLYALDCAAIVIGRTFLEKLTVAQLVNKFSAFHGTPRFMTVFTRAHHW
jgi:hypothetical protein